MWSEKKAVFCKSCGVEAREGQITCLSCDGKIDGTANVEAKKRSAVYAVAPVINKWVDRGPRSAAGDRRDDARKRRRRAEQQGFKSITHRFETDDRNNYEFRRQLEESGWTYDMLREAD